MQTLGLTREIKPTDGLLKRLFWPTIENGYDVDLVRQQGFWLCAVLAMLNLLVLFATAPVWVACAVGLTYFLAATGVREGSVGAAIAVFLTYLLSQITNFLWIHRGMANPIFTLVFLGLLLSNVRATVLTRAWKDRSDAELEAELPDRLTTSWKDKVVNVLPSAVWPRGQLVFYPLALVLLLLTALGAVRLAQQQKRLNEIRQQHQGQEIEVRGGLPLE